MYNSRCEFKHPLECYDKREYPTSGPPLGPHGSSSWADTWDADRRILGNAHSSQINNGSYWAVFRRFYSLDDESYLGGQDSDVFAVRDCANGPNGHCGLYNNPRHIDLDMAGGGRSGALSRYGAGHGGCLQRGGAVPALWEASKFLQRLLSQTAHQCSSGKPEVDSRGMHPLSNAQGIRRSQWLSSRRAFACPVGFLGWSRCRRGRPHANRSGDIPSINHAWHVGSIHPWWNDQGFRFYALPCEIWPWQASTTIESTLVGSLL